MKNLKGKMKKLTSIILSIAVLFGVANMFANADTGDTPSHHKRLIDNQDGTYKLSLDVTGESVSEVGKANVVVILDTSGSMKTTTGNQEITYTATDSNGDNLYGLVNGEYIQLRRTGRGSGSRYWYRQNGRDVEYTGQRYTRETQQTRLQAAKAAVKSLAESLLSNNTDDAEDAVQLALITFDTTAADVVGPVTKYSNIESAIEDTDADGGTNWEDALTKARTVSFGDNDPTYVIFVSDGDPTFRLTSHTGNRLYNNGSVREYNITNPDEYYYSNGWQEWRSQYAGTGHVGTGSTDYYNWNYSDAAAVAKQIVDGGATLYSIGAYGDVTTMEDLAQYAYDSDSEGTKHYYDAANTAALQDALNRILEEIETSGIGKVSISDGTTSAVKAKSGTVNLLKVDESSYQYWLSMVVTLEDGKYINEDLGEKITFENISEKNYKGTWTDQDGTHEITGTIDYDPNDTSRKIFQMEWTGANALHDETPPTAQLVTDEDGNKSVDWDLSSLGVLLNGVTYTVTFDVWPTQYTYDLIADLENEKINYSDLSSSSSNTSPYAGLDKYISKTSDGKYFLNTNTTAELTYTDTRVENPEEKTTNYRNPEPVETNADEIGITKKWENDLDSADGNRIKITVNRKTVDSETSEETTEECYDTYLDFNNHYTKEHIKIATGLMRLKENEDGTGEIEILETGHDYTFGELSDEYYKWELISETVHPMLINGQLKELVLLDEAVTQIHKIGEEVDPIYVAPDEMDTNDYYNDGENAYIKLNGKVYLITKTTGPVIDAINYRRSNLNVVKVVNGDADEDEEFELNITVDDPGLSSNESIWFSVQEDDETITDLSDMITSDGWTPESNGSGFYYAPSGTTLSIKLKVGQNLRFTNLTTQATYEITEEDKDNFVFTDANGSATYGKSETVIDYVKGTDYRLEKDGNKVTKVTGDITLTNSTYTVEIENTYDFATVGIVKIWNDHDDRDGLRDDIEIQVKQDNSNFGDPITITSDSENAEDSNEWDYTITSVMVNGKETKLPRYKADGTEYKYTVTEADLEGYTTSEGEPVEGEGTVTYTFINTHVSKTEVSATKEWDDNDNQDGKREDLTFKLYKVVNNQNVEIEGAEEKTIAANATGDDLTVTWTDLDVFDEEDNEIEYTVEEETVIDGYTTTKGGSMENGFTFKNYHKTYTVDITATKEWDDDDNQDGLREDVTFKLYKIVKDENDKDTYEPIEGAEEKTIKANATGDALTVSWEGLPQNEGGSEIKYTVQETTEIDGYETTVTESSKNNFIVKNSHESATVDITATKEWDDNDNQDGLREDVTFVLCIKDGEECNAVEGEEEKTIKANATGDDLTVSWEGLPQNDGGSAIEYSVKETTKIAGYETTVSGSIEKGFIVKNSHEPATVDITATKEWDDNDNQDGLREDVTFVVCIKDGDECNAVEGEQPKTISKDATGDALTVSWTGLPQNDGGSEIKYSVKETTKIESYETTVSGSIEKGFTVKNSHEPATVDITATKVWDDADNVDGKRKDVTFKLYKTVDGKDVAIEDAEEKTISKDATGDDLTVSWTGLDKCEGGSEIKYTVKETTQIPGYEEPEVTGSIEEGFTITNSYEPGSTNIKITKKWVNVSEDGIENIYGHNRSIQVKISCKSSKADYCTDDRYTYTLSGSNEEWTITDTGLPKFRDGELLSYSAEEITTVNNYDTDNNIVTITNIGDATSENTYEIEVTNTYKPNPIKIEGTKHWEDDDDNDAVRPESITINLYDGITKDENGNDAIIKTTTATADDWTYSFDKLPETDNNGNKINYYVDEVLEGDSYVKEVNDENFDITNYHLSETVTFTVTKHWEDEDNVEGLRPETLTVYLKADDEVIDSAVLSEGNWTHTFDNEGKGYKKYKNVDGKKVAIDYTVEEENIKYYEASTDSTTGDPTTTNVNVNDNTTVPQTNTNTAYDITNKRDVEYISISGEKIWNDNNNADRIRPDFIYLRLYGNGIFIQTIKVTIEDNWKYAVYGLYKYQGGEEVRYTIEEEYVDGYTCVIDGFNVTNTHKVQEIIEVLPPKTGVEKTNNYYSLVILLATIFGVSIEETVRKIKKATI